MVQTASVELVLGAVALGAVHGIEPGHGWPVAASYALDRTNTWVYGFAASFILGVGHLISSIAMVLLFFSAKGYFNLTQVNEPIHLTGNVSVGGPVSVVAGLLLVALGVREYRHGHSHGSTHGEGDDHSKNDRANELAHDHAHDHTHDGSHAHNQDRGHNHDHGHNQDSVHEQSRSKDDGILTRLKRYLPFGGGHAHSAAQLDEAANRSLLGIAWFAFLLGFAHEEEFEIIALCAGSTYCLELMLAYAITVIVGIVGLTLVLIAGYEHFEDRVATFTPYLPAFSAAVLISMGAGFVTGVF